jgi:hypothetical protein
MSTETSSSTEWTEGNIKTIYYQGFGCSQVQVSKYVGKRGFLATTGERVICKNAVELIKNPFIGCEIDEIRLRSMTTWNWNPVSIVTEWVSGAANWYQSIEFVQEDKLKPLEYSVSRHSFLINKLNVGQLGDITTHKKRHECIGTTENDILDSGDCSGGSHVSPIHLDCILVIHC